MHFKKCIIEILKDQTENYLNIFMPKVKYNIEKYLKCKNALILLNLFSSEVRECNVCKKCCQHLKKLKLLFSVSKIDAFQIFLPTIG